MTTPLITTVTEYEDKALELIAKAQEEILGYIKQAVEVLDERMPEFEVPDLAVLDQIPTLSEIVEHPVRLLQEAPDQPGEVRQERRQDRQAPHP